MKRFILLASRLAGDTLRHSSAAIAALLFAAARCLRLLPDELPAQLNGTINLFEWVVGGLGLFFIFLNKFYQRTEKHHE